MREIDILQNNILWDMKYLFYELKIVLITSVSVMMQTTPSIKDKKL